MRILWLSRAPSAAGGYSNQTALFTPRLAAAGHEVAAVGIQGIGSGMLEWQGIPVYPLLSNDFRNSTTIGLHYQHWRADLMISLHDPDKVIDGPALLKRFPGLRWILWFPIDSDLLSASLLSRLRAVPLPIAISRFGERVARDHGLPIRYVPHGVNTSVFQPMERAAARARLGWPAGVFVAGMVAANDGTRKAFPQNIEGFASFHRKYPGSMLYLHTQEAVSGGLDLSSICTKAGLKVGTDVVFCDAYRYFIGIPETEMAVLCNAMDVFAGWKVRQEESTVENNWRLGSPDAIADRLEQAYLASRSPKQEETLRRQARCGALQYDADRVTEEYWRPLLSEICDLQ